jgi:hypothetical protein
VVRYPAEVKGIFSSVRVQTSSEGHPASYPMDTGRPFPGVKRGRCMALTTHPLLVLRPRISRSYNSFPFDTCMAVAGHLYFTATYRRAEYQDFSFSNFLNSAVNSLKPSDNCMSQLSCRSTELYFVLTGFLYSSRCKQRLFP